MFSDLSLEGRVCLITGGSRGIGAACAKRLAAAGAHVVLTYASSKGAADEVVASIEAAGGRAEAHQLDVKDGEAITALVADLQERLSQIDVLVNNAGIVKDNLLLTMSDDEWLDVLQTNLTGAVRMAKAVAMGMMMKRRGSIINLSSIAAAKPNRGQANYAASKGGVESFTRALAAELGRKKVRVNAVAPGVIETDMSQRVRDEAGAEIKKRVLLRRFGTPDDIAAAVHFLASDASAYITGQVLTVDGGIGLG